MQSPARPRYVATLEKQLSGEFVAVSDRGFLRPLPAGRREMFREQSARRRLTAASGQIDRDLADLRLDLAQLDLEIVADLLELFLDALELGDGHWNVPTSIRRQRAEHAGHSQ